MALTVDPTTTKTTDAPETAEATNQDTTTTQQKQVESKPTPPPPKDTAEKDAGDQDVETKDGKSVFGRLSDAAKDATKVAKKASKKAWELTAEAQKKVAEQPRDWKEKTIKSGGGDHLELRKQTSGPKPSKADEFEPLESGKGNPAGYFKLIGAVDGADTVASVVRNADALRAVDKWSDGMDIIKAGKTPAPGAGALGYVSLGFTVAKEAPVIYEDFTDGDGPSLDSVVPVSNIAADVVGLIPHPGTIGYSIGHTIGSFVYDDMGLGDAIDARHERAIDRQGQLGIIQDRAPRFDGTVRDRFENGNATEADFAEARTVSREAHEHGILTDDGKVNKDRFLEQMPPLSMRQHENVVMWDKRTPGNEHYYQVMDGIELAVELDNMARSRESSDARERRVSTTPTESR